MVGNWNRPHPRWKEARIQLVSTWGRNVQISGQHFWNSSFTRLGHMRFGAVILVGGKNSRMGADKAALVYQGQSFLERLLKELSWFDEILLSTGGGKDIFQGLGLPIIRDIYPGCGPIGGLHAALTACESDALFVTACDMPLLTKSLTEYLCSKLVDVDAVVATTTDGHIHPLCAVYKKTTAAVFEKLILSGNYKIMDALESLTLCYAPISEAGFSDAMMLNVNTPDDYAALLEKGMPRHHMLTGPLHCGKSSVIQKTIALTGLRIGGFITSFDPDRRVLYMSRADLPFEPAEHLAVAELQGEKMRAIPGRFDELGPGFLAESREFAELIIMDELGFLEKDAEGFKQAVLETLDHIPVLGVLRQGFPAWLREIAARVDVSVITLTDENRDQLPMMLAKRLENKE